MNFSRKNVHEEESIASAAFFIFFQTFVIVVLVTSLWLGLIGLANWLGLMPSFTSFYEARTPIEWLPGLLFLGIQHFIDWATSMYVNSLSVAGSAIVTLFLGNQLHTWGYPKMDVE